MFASILCPSCQGTTKAGHLSDYASPPLSRRERNCMWQPWSKERLCFHSWFWAHGSFLWLRVEPHTRRETTRIYPEPRERPGAVCPPPHCPPGVQFSCPSQTCVVPVRRAVDADKDKKHMELVDEEENYAKWKVTSCKEGGPCWLSPDHCLGVRLFCIWCSRSVFCF